MDRTGISVIAFVFLFFVFLFFFLLRVSSLVCVWIEIQMALCDDADTKIQKYDEIFHKLLLIESSCFFCVCVLLHAGRVTFISHHIAIPFEWIIKTFRIILYRKMERMKKKNWIYSCCFIYSRFAFWSYSLLKWKKKCFLFLRLPIWICASFFMKGNR